MAIGDRRFTRIPPESTGDRIQVKHVYTIPYASKSGIILIGNEVECSSSALSGTIVDIKETTVTAGIIWVAPTSTSEDLDTVSGENIQINSSTVAVVSGSGYPVFSNSNTIVGWNNPLNGQYVDTEGQAFVRFKDGAVELDAFNRLRTSQLYTIAEYIFNYNVKSLFFSSSISGTATITHDTVAGAALLSNGTASGDSIKYTSDLYHPYTAGMSQHIEMSVACGDSGKANLERTWGYFDDNNGIFFRQTENDFEVVVRSNTSGVIVETAISQADFNVDVVDGTSGEDNLSRFALDTSKDVVYWISFQWLGAGKVRMGCLGNGKRIAMHEFRHSGQNAVSYMRSGTLPIRIQQTNVGATGSSSEMRMFCSHVSSEGNKPQYPNLLGKSFSEFTVTDTELYCFSLRPAELIGTIDNRRIFLFDEIKYSIVESGDLEQDERLIIKMFLDATLTTPTWTSIPPSGLQYDVSATLGTHLQLIGEWYVKGTGSITSVKENIIGSANRLLKKANGTLPTVTITAQNPGSGRTALAYLRPEWNEVTE